MWPSSNTIADVRKHIHHNLIYSYSIEQDRTMITSMILQHITGLSKAEIAIQPNFRINESEIVWLKDAMEDLNNNKPIQYVLGFEEFYGLKFNVNKSVLIPRPETEELVKWILDDFQSSYSKLSTIDLGTGSGCIAIALKHNRPDWNVSAIDKSSDIINIAKKNALKNKVVVDFSTGDILNFTPTEQKFDIIVSNPPYIRNSEKTLMHKNVLDYEPEMALFVDDLNPLIFYKAIAEIAQTSLNSLGCLYLEINEALGKETVDILKEFGFINVELKLDLFEKPRMVKAVKSKK